MEQTHSFGYWLRRKRKALDLTQAALAQRVGCATVTLKRIEADERRPSRQLAERLADTLLIPPPERQLFIAAARAIHGVDRLPIGDEPMAPGAFVPQSPSVNQAQRGASQAGSALTQRKQVTVLQARLLGIEMLLEHEEPAFIAQSLETLWQAIVNTVAHHGGRVMAHTEAQLFAIWGAESAREWDAEQALRAAITIRELAQGAVAAFSSLDARIGVSTGVALLKGNTTLGDPAQQSARLVTLSQDPGILVTHTTYVQVRDAFECYVQEPLPGLNTAPVAVYSVICARKRNSGWLLNNPGQFMAPVIGREVELGRLQAALVMAAEHSERTLITVVGDAGFGKSRLLAEFSGWVQAALPDARILRGRATPEAIAQPYALLRDMFSRAWDIQESDDAAAVRSRVEAEIGAALDAGGQGLSQSALLYRFLGFALGADAALYAVGAARELRARGLRALSEYLGTLASRSPVVLMLEDLHWADEASLDALAYLAEALGQTRLCMICTARPAIFERRAHWCAAPSHLRLDIGPLNGRDSRRLVAAIMQTAAVPEQLHELVVQRADGNPFYIEELIKMLVDARVIQASAARWTVDVVQLAQTHIPSTLRGVLEARLDAIPAQELIVLQQAAVIGRTFWDAAVAQLAYDTDTHVSAAINTSLPELEALQGRGIVFQRARSAFEGAREYAFKHALLRDAAYDRSVQRTRQQLHGRAARWLEAVAEASCRGDEYAAEIAAHYDGANNGASAVPWYARAARVAAGQYANAAAADALCRALELLPQDAARERYALLLEREKVHDLQADREAQGVDLQLLAALTAGLHDASRAEVALRQTRYAMLRNEYDTAITIAQQAIQWARAARSNDLEARGWFAWARSLYALGRVEEVRQPLERAYGLAQVAAQWEVQAQCLWLRGRLYVDRDQIVEAEKQFAHMLDLSRREGLHTSECDALDALGHMAQLQEHFPRVAQYYQQAYALTQKIGDRRHEALALFALAHYWLASGSYSCARVYFERSLILAQTLDSPGIVSCDLAYLGHLCIMQCDWRQAQAYVAQALGVPGMPDDKRALSLTVGGHALAGLGHLDAAKESYAQAASLWQKLDRGRIAFEAQAGMTRIALRLGTHAQALEQVSPILAHLQSGGSLAETDEPLWVLLTCSEVLQATADSRAAAFLETAYQRLQARAARFASPELQRSCLENIPHHRQLIKAWESSQFLCERTLAMQ